MGRVEDRQWVGCHPVAARLARGNWLSLMMAAMLVSGLMITVPRTPASATNMGSTQGCGYEYGTSSDLDPDGDGRPVNCVSWANNRWHAARPYSFGNQWSGIDTAVRNSLRDDYDPTDLVAYWITSDSLPDVRLWDWYYAWNVTAWVDCPADNTGIGYKKPVGTPGWEEMRWCRGQIARFNANTAGNFNQTGRDWVACHELGHTVGLRHPEPLYQNETCLDYPHPVLLVVPTTLGHDVGHINQWY